MKSTILTFLILIFSLSIPAQNIKSPDGNFSLNFQLNDSGEAIYNLSYKNKTVIKDSKIGFEIKGQPALDKDFKIVGTEVSEENKTWNPIWGEVKTIHNYYRELAIILEQKAVGKPQCEEEKNKELFISADEAFRFMNKFGYDTAKKQATSAELFRVVNFTTGKQWSIILITLRKQRSITKL